MLTIKGVQSSVSDTRFENIDKEAVEVMTPFEAPSWKSKEPVRVRFGKRLNELRTSKGYTQMQLAMHAGLDRSFISDIERGIKEPTISTLDLIAVCFKVSLSELFEGV